MIYINGVAQVGKTIVTGNYTGNDGADRHITTGMKCSRVAVVCATNNICWVGFNETINLALDTGAIGVYATGDNRIVLHATDGFIVDGAIADSANENTFVYYYWAISE